MAISGEEALSWVHEHLEVRLFPYQEEMFKVLWEAHTSGETLRIQMPRQSGRRFVERLLKETAAALDSKS